MEINSRASHKAPRGMQPVAAALEKIVAGSLRLAADGEGPVMAWAVVCGAAVSGRTRALGFADGILQVEVADKGWRNELQHLAAQYVALLNRYTRESVKRIEFVITGEEARPGVRSAPSHAFMKRAR